MKANGSITTLRTLSRSGGSTMFAVPPLWLEATGLAPRDRVSVTINADEMVVRPFRRLPLDGSKRLQAGAPG